MTDQAERGAAIVVRDLTKSYPIAGKAGTAPEGGAGACLLYTSDAADE